MTSAEARLVEVFLDLVVGGGETPQGRPHDAAQTEKARRTHHPVDGIGPPSGFHRARLAQIRINQQEPT